MSGRSVVYRGKTKIDVWLQVEREMAADAISYCIGSKKNGYTQMVRDEAQREWILDVSIPKDSGYF